MAYDESLAEKIRERIKKKKGLSEKKMFGGLCILWHGNMALGIVGKKLMVRVGPDNYESSLVQKGVLPMDFTGKPMKGMIYVTEKGYKHPKSFEKWLNMGIEYAKTFPKK